MRTRREISDDDAAALLAGRAVGDDLSDLEAFIAAARSATRGVVTPNAALTAIFANGLDIPPSPATARLTRPRRMKKVLETAVAKLAALGLATKFGIGTAVAATAVAGAGAGGALPAPVQNAVADVVAAVTPFEFPTTASENAAFGERVSTDATQGGVDGPTIAEEASQGRAGGDAADEARARGQAAKAAALQQAEAARAGGSGEGEGAANVPEQAPPGDVPRAETPEQADDGLQTGETAREPRPVSPPQPAPPAQTATSDESGSDGATGAGQQATDASGTGADAATAGAGNGDNARP
ncbi:MAG: hypothetical protein GEU74_05985 [Nitriliruptorales bacterium]|nr:hypothetical protein [Nitriliruptorales bacterium]